MKIKKSLLSASILLGTIVGAGIFGIPYVIAKSGVIPGFFYFLILGGAVLLIHLLFGEIVLRTRETRRLPGYAEKYLGARGKVLITIFTVFGLIGALLVYIILAGDFLEIIFSFLNLPSFYLSLIFWVFLSFFIFRGIKSIAPAQLFMNIMFFFIIALIFCFAAPNLNIQNFILFDVSHIFLPYGVIMFSLIGWQAIPIISETFKSSDEKKNLKKITVSAIFTAIALYFLFALIVVGVSGKATTPEALQGLLPFLGQKIIILGALFGLFAAATSFLILGNCLKNTLFYDYKIPKFSAAFIACGAPLLLFLIGFRSFIETIGFVGTLVGAVEGIAIILIFKKAKVLGDRKPEYSLKIPSVLLYFLIIIFIFGAISQVF